jgi:hypothetical protein
MNYLLLETFSRLLELKKISYLAKLMFYYVIFNKDLLNLFIIFFLINIFFNFYFYMKFYFILLYLKLFSFL